MAAKTWHNMYALSVGWAWNPHMHMCLVLFRNLSICIHFTVDYLSLLLKCRLWSLCKGLAVGTLISDASFESTGRLVSVCFFFLH